MTIDDVDWEATAVYLRLKGGKKHLRIEEFKAYSQQFDWFLSACHEAGLLILKDDHERPQAR